MIKFNLPQPNVIKADIQGFELEMLKGGRETLINVDVLLLETCSTEVMDVNVRYFLRA